MSHNNNSTALTEGIPPNWVASLRPFLQRADEFESRVPIVAYFLRTHAAFLAMQLHKQQKTAANNNNSNNNNSSNAALCKQYLLRLLNTLEQQKQDLGESLADVDGRTVLTRYALMLFSQADDAERAGAGASMRLMRLFFTASILFDATAQFTPDGCVDNVAAEKRNYARYIAVRMKRALDSGTPYESPNKMEDGEDDQHDNKNEEEGKEENHTYTHMHSNSNSNDNSRGEFVGKDMHIYNQSQQHQNQQSLSSSTLLSTPSAPPPVVPTTTTTTTTPSYSTLCPTTTHPPQNNSWSNNNNNNNNNNVSGGGGNEPSMEAILAAQKYCKQAVSALQFYDHASARQQLLAALNALDGKLKK
ncbi:Vta1 [Trypanosoma melophagium]|uniref:Vta1 n=1 Tax=Trypanosoma melophagium TaxID=715481 RepID=UPI00351A9AB7|nr:Vta1 [Trypanosoma melophagium]